MKKLIESKGAMKLIDKPVQYFIDNEIYVKSKVTRMTAMEKGSIIYKVVVVEDEICRLYGVVRANFNCFIVKTKTEPVIGLSVNWFK